MAVLQLLDRPKLFSVKILKQFHFAKIPPKLATLFPFMTTAVCLQYTVWKFQDFSVIQISRKINFGAYKSAKSAFLTNLEALNLYFHEFLYFLKQARTY